MYTQLVYVHTTSERQRV